MQPHITAHRYNQSVTPPCTNMRLRRIFERQHVPPGIIAIAIVLLLTALYLLVVATQFAGPMPLARAAFLLKGFETMGPVVLLAAAVIAIALAIGLITLHRWARRATFFLIAVLVALSIPAASSALTDFRLTTLAREGIKIVACVAAWVYLRQNEVKEAFEHSR